jgi:Flp pilus assembly protein TadG
MTRLRSNRSARRATIAPLTAVLLVPLLAMAAFAIDLGWIALVHSDLQNAADAAALAGAGQLMDGYVQYNLTSSPTTQYSIVTSAKATARQYAKDVAGYNAAEVSSLTLLDADVEFGFTDAAGTYTASSTSSYPNTVKVTLRRDNSANGSLGLFFGRALGMNTVDLQATAAATIYTIDLNSFSGPIAGILPMTYDRQYWNNFLQTGQDPKGTITTDSNGVPELKIYSNTNGPGNFGLLSLSGAHVGSSTTQNWIQYGMSQSDVNGLKSSGPNSQTSTALIPLSVHDSTIWPTAGAGNAWSNLGSWNWIGSTGMQQSDINTLSRYEGQTFLLPLFKAYNSSPGSNYAPGIGQGSDYYYNIVEFVSIKVVSTGSHSVIVQPSAKVVDFGSVTGSSQPAGTDTDANGYVLTTFLPPKLTQ